ncbi:MAG: aminotransferase class V-fold PLP-dependent enzyme [Saprospiraceae bacterium]|nr:aminotransferase class V-fold PLP-dependent enzyme [Saprospiraceae bacterium]
MNISDILYHLGEEREAYFNAIAPPIIQSSNFMFKDIEDLKAKMSDELNHHVYTRGNNPTAEILRKKMAALEKTEDALVVSSGATAIAAAVIANVSSGDHVICVQKPYSWTGKLISKFLSRFGVTYDFVNARDTENIRAAIKPNTRVLMLESPNSLTFEMQDLEACAILAKENQIVTVIDNSHCSPLFQNPALHGIDLVVHTATKYLNGHSDVVMGIICGSSSMIRKIFQSEFMTLGLNVSPHDAFLAIRGLRTLPLRVQRSEQTGAAIVSHLTGHPKVSRIYYPFHATNPQLELAKKQMTGAGGLLTIELNTTSKAKVNDFVNALDKFMLAVSWGGYESLKMPTLAFYDIPGQDDPPLPFQLVRLYAGLEEADFLIENLEKALSVI